MTEDVVADGQDPIPSLKERWASAARLRRYLQYLLLGLVLLLVFMASALLSMRFAIHGREVQVPNLADLTPAEAERRANAEGLVISIDNRFYSPDVANGHIASQFPAPGTTVRRGWKVLLSESLGPQRAAIPDVVGESELAAGINLRRRGLELGSIASVHMPGAPPQTVVAQSPPPDAKAVTSPRVDLVMTPPDNVPHYVMPNFVNKPLARAAAAVEQAGFKLGGKWGALAGAASLSKSGLHDSSNEKSKRSQVNSKPPALTGTVVNQYPPAGLKVALGTEVYFEVKQ
jgi:beta-lactam-binding protein with PASTA domain